MKMKKQDIYKIGLPDMILPINNILHQNINSSMDFLGIETTDFFLSNISNNSISICFYNKQKLINLLNEKNATIESWFFKLGNPSFQELGNNILEIKINRYA